LPWQHVAGAGLVLDPERKKMSKSKGNAETPLPLLDQYGSDAIRYWAGSARLGVDIALEEQVFKVGKRLVTKLFNAAKFVLSQSAEVGPIACELDRAFAAELRALAERATHHFEAYDEAHALMETESFFWGRFTDTYLELAKLRARSADAAERGSAVAGLRPGLLWGRRALGAAEALPAVPALHQRGDLVLGVREGDRPAEHPSRAVAARGRFRRARRASGPPEPPTRGRRARR